MSGEVAPSPRRYIADIYLSSEPGSYPHCPSSSPTKPASPTKAQRAADWARAQIGDATTPHTPSDYWSGYCETLVELANGTSGRYPTAYDNQMARGRLHSDTNPPPGALVFYRHPDRGGPARPRRNLDWRWTGGVDQWCRRPAPSRQQAHRHRSGPAHAGWAPAPSAWPGR